VSPSLILINGPPGIGKSTLARRYVADHTLALNLDIDVIRTSLGQRSNVEESKLQARRLALAMARVHLSDGHDVVVPQLVARIEFITELEELASDTDAKFCEVLVLDTKPSVLQRFRNRRIALGDAGESHHPQAEIDPRRDAEVLGATYDALLGLAELRPNTRVIHATAGQIDAAYEALLVAISQ
jgi:predicted kinase